MDSNTTKTAKSRLNTKAIICLGVAIIAVIAIVFILIKVVSKDKSSKYNGTYVFTTMTLMGQQYDADTVAAMMGATGTISLVVKDGKVTFNGDLLNMSTSEEADIDFDGSKATITSGDQVIPCLYDADTKTITIDFGSMDAFSAYGEYKMSFQKQ